jgi:hypothetical protein
LAFKRAEKYVKEYRELQKSDVRLRRIARRTNSFYLEPEAKLAFVIRIRGSVFCCFLPARRSTSFVDQTHFLCKIIHSFVCNSLFGCCVVVVVLCATRQHSINGVSPRVRKILQLVRRRRRRLCEHRCVDKSNNRFPSLLLASLASNPQRCVCSPQPR